MAGMTTSVTDGDDAEGTPLLANNFDGIFAIDQNVSVFEINIRVFWDRKREVLIGATKGRDGDIRAGGSRGITSADVSNATMLPILP